MFLGEVSVVLEAHPLHRRAQKKRQATKRRLANYAMKKTWD
jgi:hypothetical protein